MEGMVRKENEKRFEVKWKICRDVLQRATPSEPDEVAGSDAPSLRQCCAEIFESAQPQ